MKLESVTGGLDLGAVSLQGTWTPSDEEKAAAWEMYVELVTRVPVAELRENEGLLREALSSLYTLFGTTRAILRKYGPAVATPQEGSDTSFGFIAVAVLNDALRPVLAEWHPLLLDHEGAKGERVGIVVHERSWDREPELRARINEVRVQLKAYADMLEKVIGLRDSLIYSRMDDAS